MNTNTILICISLSLSLSLSQFTYPRIIPKISMRKYQVDPSKFQRNLFFELDKKILVTEYHIIAIYDFVFQKFWLQNLLPTTTQTLAVGKGMQQQTLFQTSLGSFPLHHSSQPTTLTLKLMLVQNPTKYLQN